MKLLSCFLIAIVALTCVFEKCEGFTWVVKENENVEKTLKFLLECVRTKSINDCDRLKRFGQMRSQFVSRSTGMGHTSNSHLHLISFHPDTIGNLDEASIKVYRLVKERVHIIDNETEHLDATGVSLLDKLTSK